MTNHAFPDNVNYDRICLTLGGEARLWYETIGSVDIDLEYL